MKWFYDYDIVMIFWWYCDDVVMILWWYQFGKGVCGHTLWICPLDNLFWIEDDVDDDNVPIKNKKIGSNIMIQWQWCVWAYIYSFECVHRIIYIELKMTLMMTNMRHNMMINLIVIIWWYNSKEVCGRIYSFECVHSIIYTLLPSKCVFNIKCFNTSGFECIL